MYHFDMLKRMMTTLFPSRNIRKYGTACVCSQYNELTDWLILGMYSPVISGLYGKILYLDQSILQVLGLIFYG